MIRQPSSSSLVRSVCVPPVIGNRCPIGVPAVTNGCVAVEISRPLAGERISKFSPGLSGSVTVATVSPSWMKLPAGVSTSNSPP